MFQISGSASGWAESGSAGPYYYGGYAYLFYYKQSSGSSYISGIKSNDGSFWAPLTDFFLSSGLQGLDPDVFSLDEYNNGVTHTVYCMFARATVSGTPPVFYALLSFDFTTDTWSTVSNTGPLHLANQGTGYLLAHYTNGGLYTPVSSGLTQFTSDPTSNTFLRVDSTTGIPYLIYTTYLSSLTGGSCSGGGNFTQLDCVYSSYSGGWSSPTSLASSPSAGLVGAYQAWFLGSTLFSIISTVTTDGISSTGVPGADPCNSMLGGAPRNRESSFTLVSTGGMSTTPTAPYAYNRPGTYPYTDGNDYVAHDLGTVQPKIYSFNAKNGVYSKPVIFGGKAYFSGVSQSKTLVIFSCDASTLTSYDTGQSTSVGLDLDAQGTRGGDFTRVFVNGGKLYAIWKGLPEGTYNFSLTYPANGTTGSGGTVNIHASASSPFSPSVSATHTDVLFAQITSSSIGTPVSLAMGEIGADAHGGTTAWSSSEFCVMPVVIPANPNDLSFATYGLLASGFGVTLGYSGGFTSVLGSSHSFCYGFTSYIHSF